MSKAPVVRKTKTTKAMKAKAKQLARPMYPDAKRVAKYKQSVSANTGEVSHCPLPERQLAANSEPLGGSNCQGCVMWNATSF